MYIKILLCIIPTFAPDLLNMLLQDINSPEDLKKCAPHQLVQLAGELRTFIIDSLAVNEGHLGANLGVVELTLALHYVFDTPYDKLIWDVGHQAYAHKILTGRRTVFNTNRQSGGISGFPKRSESPYDAFGTGHSSTAISAILGMALASQLKGKLATHHIAVIGDASIASGMAFEALNHLGVTRANVLIVLNDNAMGIDPSVGALKAHFAHLKTGLAKHENFFKCLGIPYCGPVDGHNVKDLIQKLEALKTLPGPKLLHITTTKGKGLKQAEENQVLYHAPGKLDPTTGERLPEPSKALPPKYQEVFGHTLLELARKNENIVAITPAMPTGSALTFMMEALPHRTFDVGIAEQHAVTLAAGMAAEGLIPFCVIYSTFLQRAYDQIIHDVALQNLPVIFCVDRAGLVGQDGATHHGVFDIAYLRCIPNLTVFAPMDERELRNMLYTAQLGLKGPLAIRYPRDRAVNFKWKTDFQSIETGTARCLKKGSQTAILTLGTMGHQVLQLLETLGNPQTIGLYDMRFVKPLDTKTLRAVFSQYHHIITVEEGCLMGGFGSAITEFAQAAHFLNPIKNFGIPDTFIEQGSLQETRLMAGIDANTLRAYLQSTLT